MSNVSFYTDVTLTSNVPSASVQFICVEKTPSKVVFLDVSTVDMRLQQKITVTVRPGNENTKTRQKFAISYIKPVLVNEGETDEYVDVHIGRFESEVPAILTYTERLTAARSLATQLEYLIKGFNTQNNDIASWLKYGTIICD